MIFSLLGGVGGLTLREYVLVNGFSTGAIGAVAGGIFGFWAIDGITKHRATNGLVTLVAQVLNKMVCLMDPPSRLLFFSLSSVRFSSANRFAKDFKKNESHSFLVVVSCVFGFELPQGRISQVLRQVLPAVE